MPAVFPLVHMITRLSALTSMLTSWEMCAFKFVEENRPSSVAFICDSVQLCPANSLYKKLHMPFQTIFNLATHELPLFHHHDLVFLINDHLISWSNESVTKYRLGGRNDFKLLIVANVSDSFEDDLASMKDLFAALWLSGIVRCAVLLVNTSVQLYTYLPFKNASLCEDTTPVLIGDCSREFDKTFEQTHKTLNLNQCPIRVGESNDVPFFKYPLRGLLSPLIAEMVGRINGTATSVTPRYGYAGSACKEQEGTRGMAYNGTAHMAVATFVFRDCSVLEYISSGHMLCLSWCTPVLSGRDYVYSFLLRQLKLEVWIALLVSVLVVSVSVLLSSTTSAENWTANKVFNLAMMIYAQTPATKPRCMPARLIVGLWLCTCLVLRAVYEGEMKGQSAVQQDYHIIYSLDELSNTDLTLCTTTSSLQQLQKDDNPLVQKISKRTKACDGDLFHNTLAAARLKDRATLLSRIICLTAASEYGKDKVSLYSMTGGCVRVYQLTPIVTLPGSPFRRGWRTILSRCDQAGLILKWLDLGSTARDQGGARPFSIGHLLPALFVLGLGCLGGFLALVGEKSYFTWSNRKIYFEKAHYITWSQPLGLLYNNSMMSWSGRLSGHHRINATLAETDDVFATLCEGRPIRQCAIVALLNASTLADFLFVYSNFK